MVLLMLVMLFFFACCGVFGDEQRWSLPLCVCVCEWLTMVGSLPNNGIISPYVSVCVFVC